MLVEILRDLERIGAVALHAQPERLDAEHGEPGIERRLARAEIAQADGVAVEGVGHVAEGLEEVEAVIGGLGAGEARELASFCPVELAGVHHGAAHRRAGAAQELGGRVDDQGRAVVDRLAEPRCGERVVDDQGNACIVGDLRDRLEVADHAAGVGETLDEEGLGLGCQRALEVVRLVGVDDVRLPAELRIGVAHLLQRATVEAGGGDDLVAWGHQREQRQHLCRMTRRRHRAASAAFERGQPRLERGVGRVGQPRIDEAYGLQVEQGGGVVGILEDIGRGLVDRQRSRAGGRVGRRAGMHRQGFEAVGLVAHEDTPRLKTMQAGLPTRSLNEVGDSLPSRPTL